MPSPQPFHCPFPPLPCCHSTLVFSAHHGSDTGVQLAALGGDDSWEDAVCRFLRNVCGTDQDCLTEMARLIEATAVQWGLASVSKQGECERVDGMGARRDEYEWAHLCA